MNKEIGMACTVRLEAPAERQQVVALTEQAFRHHPHSQQTEAAIIQALDRDGALSLSLVAVDETGSVIGHLALSPVTTGQGAAGWYGLGPMAVRPDRQGRGVGSALVRAALGWLDEQGANGCVLLGEPAFYGRLGFAADPALRFPGVPAEYFLCRRLRGPAIDGDVVYHPAFYQGPAV
jgi:putative acetyltransferase